MKLIDFWPKKSSAITAIATLSFAMLSGCGGSDAQDASGSVVQSEVVDVGADVRSSVLVTGSGSGFVAIALTEGLKAGTTAGYDVLVVDGGATEDVIAMAELAIESGKRVVVDGKGEINSRLIRRLGGMSADADAALIMRAQNQDGYVVVPIDTEVNASKRKTTLKLQDSSFMDDDLPSNTVKSVFGL